MKNANSLKSATGEEVKDKLTNQMNLNTINIENRNFTDESLLIYLKENEKVFKQCFSLKIVKNNLRNFAFPFEITNLNKLYMKENKLITIENFNNLNNLTLIDLSYNNLKAIPEIYGLNKLEILILNNNLIETADFNKFKDLRNINFINLQSNRIIYKNSQDFAQNMKILQDKLKLLKTFYFEDNLYFPEVKKEKIIEFLKFFKNEILMNENYEKEKEKKEKEFVIKLSEITQFQLVQDESIVNKVKKIKNLINKFSLDTNTIDLKYQDFKELTNNFLNIISKEKSHIYKQVLENEAEDIVDVFNDLIRECVILTDKIDHQNFIEHLMKFLLGILTVQQGVLAESIMDYLTHLATDKKMEKHLVKVLIEQFTAKANFDFKLKGESNFIKDYDNMFNEIKGQSNPVFNPSKNEKSIEEVSLISEIRANPKILDSFKMIVDDKYETLFVYLFKLILKNSTHTKFMTYFNQEEKAKTFNSKENNLNTENVYINSCLEFFKKCFTSKAKHTIMKSLTNLEVIKLISFSIGIIKNFENYMSINNYEEKNLNSTKFLENVMIFTKIFKSILKYYFFSYLNKKVFSVGEKEQIQQIDKFKKIFIIDEKESNNEEEENEEDEEYNDRQYNIDPEIIGTFDENDAVFIGNNNKFNNAEKIAYQVNRLFDPMMKKVVEIDIGNKKGNKYRMDNLSRDNFESKMRSFIELLFDNYYFKVVDLNRNNEKFNANNFVLISTSIAYLIKINIMIKSTFTYKESKDFLPTLNDFNEFLKNKFLQKIKNNDLYQGNNETNRKMKSNLEIGNLKTIRSMVEREDDEDEMEQGYFNENSNVTDLNNTMISKKSGPKKGRTDFRNTSINNTIIKQKSNLVQNNNQDNIKGSVKREKNYLNYNPQILNAINFSLNLFLNQYSLLTSFESVTSINLILGSYKENFVDILKNIDENTINYKSIYKFSNFLENKKEDVGETKMVNLGSLSNIYMIKFINSSLNVLVYLGKLNENHVHEKYTDKEKDILKNPLQVKYEKKNRGNVLNKNLQINLDSITQELNNNNRDDIMLKCINIPNMDIKRKIMEILLTVDYNQISDDEFQELIKTLKMSNFLEMNMEDIITKSFIFIIRLINFKTNTNNTLTKSIKTSIIDDTIECGIKLAHESNKKKISNDRERFLSSQNLNLILSVFLINFSANRKLRNVYMLKEEFNKEKGKSEKKENINQNIEFIKNIIECEINSIKDFAEKSELIDSCIPFFFEKVYAMWNIRNIGEFLFKRTINPYNFVVFRLFRQIADALMNIPYKIFDLFNEREKIENIIVALKNEFKLREYQEVEKEKRIWNESKIFLQELENKFDNDEDETENKNKIKNISILFAKNIKLKSNLPILTEGKMITLETEKIDEQKIYFADNFEKFLNFLIGESHEISIRSEVQKRLYELKFDDRFKKMESFYVVENMHIDVEHQKIRLYSNKEHDQEPSEQIKNDNVVSNIFQRFFGKNNNGEEDENRHHLLNNSRDNKRKNSIDNDLNLEPIIKNYLKFIDKSSSKRSQNLNFYSHIKEDLREECDLYGTYPERVYRIRDHETVDNCYLRSLIIAAFLRCIYAVTKNAHKKPETKSTLAGQELIRTLRNGNTFQKFISLVDCTKLKDCNINTKILIIVKHIFEKISVVKESSNNKDNTIKKQNEINKYEFQKLILLSSLMINKTLDNIYFTHKTISNDPTHDDRLYTILVKKLVKCCLCIKKELFKNISLNSDEKKDLLRKILSTRLIMVLINHALKIMENDIPLQNKLKTLKNVSNSNADPNSETVNKINNNSNSNEKKNFKSPREASYNDYFLDLIILLAEFISCREEIYIIIIEYINKKYYIDKKPIRQSFIKDLADLKYYSYSTSFLEEYKNTNLSSHNKDIDEFTNILFIGTGKIHFYFFEKHIENFSNELTKKHFRKKKIENEIFAIILDQKCLLLKKIDETKKILKFYDLFNSKTILKINFHEYPFKELSFCSYGNRIFIRQANNLFCMSIFFKKAIESNLFFSAIKNITKKLPFKRIELSFEMNDQKKESKSPEELLEENKDSNFKICGKDCYNSEANKDTYVVKPKETPKKANVEKIVTKIKINKFNNQNNEENDDSKSVISQNEGQREDINEDNDYKKGIEEIEEELKRETNGDRKLDLLKQKNELRKKRATDRALNNSISSNGSKRSKSNILKSRVIALKMKSEKEIKAKIEAEQVQVGQNKQDNLDISEKKIVFSDRTFMVSIDFSNFSNIEELREINIYDNLFLIKLNPDYTFNVYKEKIEAIASHMQNLEDEEIHINKFLAHKEIDNSNFFKEMSDSFELVDNFDLKSVKNIHFDNRKIIIDFKKNMDFMFSRPIQIYPMDDRSFYFLRNYFVKFIYLYGFMHCSKNYLTDPLSTRIFKN